jgi:hypothetical protein
LNAQHGFDDFEGQGDELVPEDWPTFYTPVPVWVLLSGCSAQAYRMYAFLAEHINNRIPGQRIACPKQVAIARAMGLSSDRKAARYRKELEELGAIRVQEYRYGGGMRRGYRYFVRFNPPAGYEGLLSLQAFYAANPDVKSAKAMGRTKTGTSHVPAQASAAADDSGPKRAGDGVEASTPAPVKKPKKSAGGSGVTVAPEVAQVLAAFPKELREAMQETAHTETPKTLLTEIGKQLRERTVEQLVDRVSRRWLAHGYAQKFEARELARPVGAAVAMVRQGECPDARCEDGRVLDTGADCVLCIERGKNYKADHARARKAKREAEEAARRQVMCPSCQRDRGTNGAVCTYCVDKYEHAIAEAADNAAANITAMANAKLGSEAREHVLAEAQKAREEARETGAPQLGQFLAARLAAETAAAECRRMLLQEVLPEPDPEAVAAAQAEAQQPVPCSGRHWDGSRCHRTTTAEDGLCGPCRGARLAQQQDHGQELTTAH